MAASERAGFGEAGPLALALCLGPLLYPALMLGMGYLTENRIRTQVDKTLEIPMVGAEHAPNLVKFLATNGITAGKAPDNLDAAIRSQEIDVALRIGELPDSSLQAVKVGYEFHRYDAQHAFFNETHVGEKKLLPVIEYEPAAAQLAWQRHAGLLRAPSALNEAAEARATITTQRTAQRRAGAGRGRHSARRLRLARCARADLDRRTPGSALTLVFSAKESVYKAFFGAVRRYFGFHDARITRVEERSGAFFRQLESHLTGELSRGYTFEGRYERVDGGLVTAVAFPSRG